jgi:hypothetical protein
MKSRFRKLQILRVFSPKNIRRLFIAIYKYSSPRTRTDELEEIISEEKYSKFLEVGVWRGQNIITIAKKFPNILCYAVDPYDYEQYIGKVNNNFIKPKLFESKSERLLKNESERIFEETSSYQNRYNNFKLIRKSSVKAALDFENASLDLVFIDAIHTYESVKKDIETWLPKVRVGGCLSGHDYSVEFFGVIQAVNEKLGVDNIVIKSDATWFYFKQD